MGTTQEEEGSKLVHPTQGVDGVRRGEAGGFGLDDMGGCCLDDEGIDAVVAVLRSGWLSLGPRTEDLEQAFAGLLGTDHAVATSSAGGALHLALLGAGVKAGDEVLLSGLAPLTAANAVVHCGADPVFVDVIGPADFGLDPDALARRAGPRAKALLATHVAGYALEPVPLLTDCEAAGLALIQTGPVAPVGRATAVDFAADGLLPGGRGGLVATDDVIAAALMRRLRSHGMTAGSWSRFTGQSAGYDAIGLGFNYRIDEPLSVMALHRMRHLEAEAALRGECVQSARSRLSRVPQLTMPFDAALTSASACHGLPVVAASTQTRDRIAQAARSELAEKLGGLPRPTHELTAYRGRFGAIELPNTAAAVGRSLLLTPAQCADGALLTVLEQAAIA